MASKTSILCLLFSLLSLLQLHRSTAQTVVKGGYWFPASGFPASSINSTLFTHLFCAFADLDPSTNKVTISSENANAFSTFTTTVQQKNPSVKTLLSIGGGSSNKTQYSSMATQASSRKAFIDSSISVARSNGFSGLDLDWEYPTTTTDMTNFGTLLTEWRAAVANESKNSGKAALLLTAAVYYASKIEGLSYPVSSISASLDWINAMAYDFYGPGWSQVTRLPAQLYDPGSQYNGNYGIVDWIQAGLSAKKIVLGFPFYGYAWRLVNANNHGLFAATSGAATAGDGSMGYNQIRQVIANGATKVYNSTYVGDYCYVNTTWIGYDDTPSISTKVSYAKGKGLLGYFAWHVGVDYSWVLSQTGKYIYYLYI